MAETLTSSYNNYWTPGTCSHEVNRVIPERIEGWKKSEELARNLDGSTTRKKPVVDECVLRGPRNKDGRVKPNGNLYLYMEEMIHNIGRTGGKESEVKM